jgi:hypothetical protein
VSARLSLALTGPAGFPDLPLGAPQRLSAWLGVISGLLFATAGLTLLRTALRPAQGDAPRLAPRPGPGPCARARDGHPAALAAALSAATACLLVAAGLALAARAAVAA